MSGETNTLENRFMSTIRTIGLYMAERWNSDSGELAIGGKEEDKSSETEVDGEGNKVDKDEKDENKSSETTEVDKDSDAFKQAVTAKVEEILASRHARDKDKITAAETAKSDAEKKLSDQLAAFNTLKDEKEAAETAKSEALRNATRFKLALEEGVSPQLIATLQGDTEDELRAAIKTVNESFRNNNGGVNRIFDGKGESGKVSDNTDLKKVAAEVFSSSLF